MIFVLAACLLSGCLGDKVVGTWKSTDSNATITFNKDKTFTANLGLIGTYQGTWEKDGNVYNLYYRDAKFGTAELSGKNLTVKIGGIISFNQVFVKQ
ncbi:MAG: hypothetical protein FWE54_02915 [Methanimicrococcus sp.]|nr:hypothetical protein [Methanimicrococcus sp.]